MNTQYKNKLEKNYGDWKTQLTVLIPREADDNYI